jgi:hypothetical protein
MVQVLGWIVVVVPLIATLVFIFIPDPKENPRMHKTWRVSFVALGVIYSGVAWWQQTLQKSEADADARSFRESLVTEERNSKDRFDALTSVVNTYFAKAAQQPISKPIPPVKVPTAEEIAAALDQRLKAAQPIPTPYPTKPAAPLVLAAPISTPTPPPCDGNHLNECTTEQLLDWGKPLSDNIEGVVDAYMADLKKLDEIKEPKKNWFKEFVGVSGNSEWLKAYALAQETAAERFRNCCAENALAYHKALASRLGGGKENREVYEWIENLIKPAKSKEHKSARDDLGKMIELNGDLHSFQIRLEFEVRLRQRAH